MGNRATIEMVAQIAGVSRGTVDRVLNGRPHVRPDARARVLSAIAETGYISPREAHQRALADTFKPLHLGVLLPNEWETQFREEVLRGVEQAREELEGSGVRITVSTCKTDLPREAMERLEGLVEQGADGLAVCAAYDHSIAHYVSGLADRGIPCVTFNSDLPESRRLCFVGQDIRRAGRVAAELLSKCVRPPERILAAVGNLKFDGHLQRLLGFQERLEELGYPRDLVVTAETFNDYGTTVSVVSDALARYPDLKGIYMANLSITRGSGPGRRKKGRHPHRLSRHQRQHSRTAAGRNGGLHDSPGFRPTGTRAFTPAGELPPKGPAAGIRPVLRGHPGAVRGESLNRRGFPERQGGEIGIDGGRLG